MSKSSLNKEVDLAVVGLDMDGTIADFITLALDVVNKQKWTKRKLTTKDINKPDLASIIMDHKVDDLEIPNKEEIYCLLSEYRKFFYELKPLPGVVENIQKLMNEHFVVIITKMMNWRYCPMDKHDWLLKYFPKKNYEIAMVSDHRTKGLINVDFMVDDDPRVIESMRGGFNILIEQPWNEDYRKKNNCYSVPNLDGISEIITHLESYQTNF